MEEHDYETDGTTKGVCTLCGGPFRGHGLPASCGVSSHKHDFRDNLIEVRNYSTSATVGIFRCACGCLFARPLSEAEASPFPAGEGR